MDIKRYLRDKHFLLGSTALVVLAALLRLETLAKKHLWYDEIYTFDFARKSESFLQAWSSALVDGWEHPPLHYALSYFMLQISESAWALRFPSAIAGIGTVLLISCIAGLLRGRVSAIVALALSTFSLYHINYSQDGRPYALMVFFLCAEFLSLLLYFRYKKAFLLLIFVFTTLGAIYSHHLALLPQASIGLVILLGMIHRFKTSESADIFLKQWFIPLFISGLLILLIYLPQLQNFLLFAQSGKLDSIHALSLNKDTLLHLIARWGAGDNYLIVTIYACCLSIGMWKIVQRKQIFELGVIFWLLAAPLTFTLLPFSKFFDIRFMMASLPAFWLLVALGLDDVYQFLYKRTKQGASFVLTILLILCILPNVMSYFSFRKMEERCSNFFYQKELLNKYDGLCRKHIILNSLNSENSFLLRKIES